MTNEEAIEQFQNAIDLIKQNGKDWLDERDIPLLDMAINALKSLDKLDEIITEQIDISYNQIEYQTLRWVLDMMSEMSEVEK